MSILVLLAYPSFNEPVNKSECLEARVLLLDAANRLESYYALHQSYAGVSLGGLGIEEQTRQQNYRLELHSSDHSYELRATPRTKAMCGVYVMGPEGLS